MKPQNGYSSLYVQRDSWTATAGFAAGKLMRPVNRKDQLAGESMTPQSIFEAVERYSQKLGIRVAPHDLRRTCRVI